MKKYTIILLLTCSYAGCLLAQDAQVPEFKNEPMLLKQDGSLGKLEKTSGESKTRTAGGPFGYAYSGGGAEMDYTVFQQAKSPVRVGTDARFIVKLGDADVDPASVFYLTKAVIKRNTREIYTKKSAGRSTSEMHVDVDFEKVSPGVYRIIPKGLQPNTEYGFVSTGGGGTLVSLFGTGK